MTIAEFYSEVQLSEKWQYNFAVINRKNDSDNRSFFLGTASDMAGILFYNLVAVQELE